MEESTSTVTKHGGRELPNDLIESIIRRLPMLDIVRTKILSSYWKSFAESILLPSRKSPWLILPPQQEKEESTFTNYSSNVVNRCRLVNLQENIAYPLSKTSSDFLSCIPVIGSSHGWLIFSDYLTLTPVLYNPFTEKRIVLPSFKSFLNISKIEEMDDPVELRCLINNEWKHMHVNEVFQSFVTKAVLTADPNAEFGVVLKCSYGKDILLYFKKGDSSWKQFLAPSDDEGLVYGQFEDMICFENRIYVLENWLRNWVYVWDLENGYPAEKVVIIKPDDLSPEMLEDGLPEEAVGFTTKTYLVELNGEILLVPRFIAESDVEIGTSRTFMSNIFKLDLENNEWVKANNVLGPDDVSLFVGRNHSVSVTKDFGFFGGNKVYFTHDFF